MLLFKYVVVFLLSVSSGSSDILFLLERRLQLYLIFQFFQSIFWGSELEFNTKPWTGQKQFLRANIYNVDVFLIYNKAFANSYEKVVL